MRLWCLWGLIKRLWFLTRVKESLLCFVAALLQSIPSSGEGLASVSKILIFCLV